MSQVLNGYETTKQIDAPCDVTVTKDSPSDKCSLDVNIQSGTVASVPSGLKTAGLITEVTLAVGVWTAIPASSLANRNSMGIQNATGDQIRLNFNPAAATTVGWIVNPNGEFFIDITDNITLYATAVTGTPTVTVMELS